jgi:hypothetical protein
MLADPIVRLLMRRDGVEEAQIRDLMDKVGQHRAPADDLKRDENADPFWWADSTMVGGSTREEGWFSTYIGRHPATRSHTPRLTGRPR